MSPWTEELRAEVFELWKDMTASQIAVQLNMRGYTFSRNAVIGVLHRAGITIENKDGVHPQTPYTGARRPRVPRHEQIGAPAGSFAYQVISGIRRKRDNGPVRSPKPFVCQATPEIEPLNIPFEELEAGDRKCRWPLDAPDGTGGAFVYCGHQTPDGKPYCTGHARIAFQPMVPVKKTLPYVELGRSSGGVFGRTG